MRQFGNGTTVPLTFTLRLKNAVDPEKTKIVFTSHFSGPLVSYLKNNNYVGDDSVFIVDTLRSDKIFSVDEWLELRDFLKSKKAK